MIKLQDYIQEKLQLNDKSKIKTLGPFTDKELMDDYNEVKGAYTKAEKEKFAMKYGINTNKIREIQIVILNYLRDNRQKKKEFEITDFQNFTKYDLPEKYEKLKEYLDKETEEFLKFVLHKYKELFDISRYNERSIAGRHVMKRISQLEKYLGIH